MEILLFWFAFAVIIGVWASNRGRSGVGWFFLALVVSPILSAILLAVLPSRDRGPEKTCPKCAETVKAAAEVCRHCGFEFTRPSAAAGVTIERNRAAPDMEAARGKAKAALKAPL